jgi:hypothetical protein
MALRGAGVVVEFLRARLATKTGSARAFLADLGSLAIAECGRSSSRSVRERPPPEAFEEPHGASWRAAKIAVAVRTLRSVVETAGCVIISSSSNNRIIEFKLGRGKRVSGIPTAEDEIGRELPELCPRTGRRCCCR